MDSDRRKDDPWKADVSTRFQTLEEKLEKNNAMTAELLEVWDTIKGGLKALEGLVKVGTWVVKIGAGVAAIWISVKHFFKLI